MRRQFDVGIAFGTFSVVVVGTAAAAAPSPYRALSRNVVETTFTRATPPECIVRRSSFRRSKEQNVSKETNLLFLVLGLSSNHPLFAVLLLVFEFFSAFADVSKRNERAQRVRFKEKR